MSSAQEGVRHAPGSVVARFTGDKLVQYAMPISDGVYGALQMTLPNASMSRIVGLPLASTASRILCLPF